MEKYPSRLLQSAVEAFAQLPGIGKKTALRLVLHLLKQETQHVQAFTQAISELRDQVVYCKTCHNISDNEQCEICRSAQRDRSIVCVVEDLRDVMAIENTSQFHGLYHVLGGIISPMDGIGPNDLHIETLISRVETGQIKEIILALSTTMEGDTTSFYLSKKLSAYDLKLSTIARGIAIGDELEYADEITLGRSILNRTPYQSSFSKP